MFFMQPSKLAKVFDEYTMSATKAKNTRFINWPLWPTVVLFVLLSSYADTRGTFTTSTVSDVDTQLRLYQKFYPREFSFSSYKAAMGQLLSKINGSLGNTYESVGSSLFPYYDSYVADDLPEFKVEYNLSSVLPRDICRKEVPTDANNIFRYYSGNIMQTEFDRIRETLPIASMIKTQPVLHSLSINMWLGDADVRATLHYDIALNVFIQLAGVKRFKLLPPRAVFYTSMQGRQGTFGCQSRLRDVRTGTAIVRKDLVLSSPTGDCMEARDMSADSHRDALFELVTHSPSDMWQQSRKSERQSQSQPQSQSQSPDATKNRASVERWYEDMYDQLGVEVELHPGDMLTIPPFWLHEVSLKLALPSH